VVGGVVMAIWRIDDLTGGWWLGCLLVSTINPQQFIGVTTCHFY
jgi:hypothetical protein